MKKLISAFLLVTLLCSLVGCNTSEPSIGSTESSSTNKLETSAFKVDFKESKVVTIDFSSGTENMLLLFFECTNDSDRNVTPMDSADIDAFQNGIALDFYTLYDLDEMGDAISCDTKLQSGASATAVWFFELRDDSTVSVEVNGESFAVEVK